MPRGKSVIFIKAKQDLIRRIRNGYCAPGARFISSRIVAREYAVSYATAQSILAEIESEGYLERRAKSGTYIPGAPPRYESVQLVFDPEAQAPGTLGGIVLRRLMLLLRKERVPLKLAWTDRWKGQAKNSFLVLWNVDNAILREVGVARGGGLLLDRFPLTASAASRFDSVTFDGFSVGLAAASMLRERANCSHVAILSNPYGRQMWAEQCVNGFRALWPRARLVRPLTWKPSAAPAAFEKLMAHPHDAVFCCHQDLAIELARHCAERRVAAPCIIAAGKIPAKPELKAPYIFASPDDMAAAAARIVRNRFLGDSSKTVHMALPPRAADSAIL